MNAANVASFVDWSSIQPNLMHYHSVKNATWALLLMALRLNQNCYQPMSIVQLSAMLMISSQCKHHCVFVYLFNAVLNK